MDGNGSARKFRHFHEVFRAMWVIVSAGLVFACASGGSSSSETGVTNPLPLTPVTLPGLNPAAVPPGHYVFTGFREWNDFWSDYHKTAAPDLDLEESALVAVFLGQKPNPGYSAGIVGAVEHRDEVVIEVVEYLPAPGMMYAQMIVYPYAARLIPETGKTIRFEVTKQAGRP